MNALNMSMPEEYGGRVYEGIWRILASWFRVPRQPPELPQQANETIASRRPAPGFLRYLRFGFAILMAILCLVTAVGWLAVTIASPALGLIVLLPVVLLMAGWLAIGWVAIRLRYDTTWYVFSDRSMRLRRGIWLIREITITFENIQNVQTRQGPLQRFFGIADVIVETAGGGASPQGGPSTGHQGLIEGISDAAELRDAIREKIAASRTTGLGDEHEPRDQQRERRWSPQQIAVLQEIDLLLRTSSDR
tara:strand:+ start:663 stop:1409 length:747 start_codon:yes stop_codon:yes gene_type:complete